MLNDCREIPMSEIGGNSNKMNKRKEINVNINAGPKNSTRKRQFTNGG